VTTGASRNPEFVSFEHEAMKTLFHLRLPPGAHGAVAASACFLELERLEGLLSRYRPDSDIARINLLSSGESIFIDEATHAVLQTALTLHVQTGGVFDITMGRQTLHRNNAQGGEIPPLTGSLALDPTRPMVTCLEVGRHLDLGAIGKGYALDRLAQVLADHGMLSALLSAGASTHLAIGPDPWTLALTGDEMSLPLVLRDAALSASGTGMQGNHVLGPGGIPPTSYPHRRAWTVATIAAQADALSTACLLLEHSQLRQLHPPGLISVFVEAHEGAIQKIENND